MKNMTLTLTALLLLAAFTLLFVACDVGKLSANVSSEVVRIHIRANSNSEEDQQVKLLVRDVVTDYLCDTLQACTDKNDALVVLESNTEKIAEIADCELKQHKFDYTTTVCVKTDYFPEKTYDGYIFPEGYYDALMIYLGEGGGDNWWCVAFPPLCFVPDGDGEEIEYKSWVKELLNRIFG